MKVFVSYRRTDVSGYAGRLVDALVFRLGPGNVFHDVTAITPGRDFQRDIDASLVAADAVLAMIGPGWLTAVDGEGRRRLHQEGDFVRVELARALAGRIPVVPVLVGGAVMPRTEDLPADLADLPRRQAVTLRDESFHADVDRLLAMLRGERAGVPGRSRRRLVVPAATAALALAVAGAVWWGTRDAGSSSGGGGPGRCPDPSGRQWTTIGLGDTPSTSETYENETLVFGVRRAASRPDGKRQWLVVLDTTMTNDSSGSVYHDWYRYDSLDVAGRPDPVTCFDRTGEGLVLAGTTNDGRVGFVVHCPPDGAMALRLADADPRPAFRFTQASVPGDCADPSQPSSSRST